ncbi:DUF2071 domain-containing protein [Solitalea sp. MAHUQ-68]|uniref:DUF2071 domain-containing protein n=1 Tax=Solitalea agri TaxID=2953739 RepID=A0A9X2F3G0_9SPHI|nr:DUF2071 domain-containing protein [Solitalea agri]MCO4294047.1 DUF2071 domain-containing protein [Solitalea agri]
MPTKSFLTAEWRKLAIANYEVNKNLLTKFLPKKTELDLWNDTCYVSLVGFKFVNTRLKGFRIPFHSDFEEVNLRFYVRYKENGEWKRGVTFIKEIVTKPALTFVANTIYGEKYETMPMSHSCQTIDDHLHVEYSWKKEQWQNFRIRALNKAIDISEGSEEEFITEHYWGYTQLNSLTTSEYGVEHPKWKMYTIRDYSINVDFGAVYGNAFSSLTNEQPLSVMLAEGSEIIVKAGRQI